MYSEDSLNDCSTQTFNQSSLISLDKSYLLFEKYCLWVNGINCMPPVLLVNPVLLPRFKISVSKPRVSGQPIPGPQSKISSDSNQETQKHVLRGTCLFLSLYYSLSHSRTTTNYHVANPPNGNIT